jgi:hypothetical protein
MAESEWHGMWSARVEHLILGRHVGVPLPELRSHDRAAGDKDKAACSPEPFDQAASLFDALHALSHDRELRHVRRLRPWAESEPEHIGAMTSRRIHARALT